MILDSRCVCVCCFFVDMVVKQSETCFWCRFMSPCYPSIQKKTGQWSLIISTWYTPEIAATDFFNHPFLLFIGHLFISTPNDFSPPKHVVKITFHAASGWEGWEEQAETLWQGLPFYVWMDKTCGLEQNEVSWNASDFWGHRTSWSSCIDRFTKNNSALIGVGTIMIPVIVETFCFRRRGKWWKSILC